jgi:hypothetical protein
MIHTHHSRLAAALAFTLFFAAASQADEYSLDYSVIGRYEYNDNINLSAANEIDISGGKISLPATLAVRNERMDASLMGELASSKYNESAYDSDDQNLQGRAKYQLERGELEGRAGYQRDSTVNSEFLDTGLVGLESSRVETASAGGSGFHMFTQKNGISAGVDYSNVDYQSDLYQDYEYISGYGGWIHEWSELTTLRLQAYGSRYENDAGNLRPVEVESDSLGVQAGFDYDVSEQLSASVLGGWLKVKTEYDTGTPFAPDDDDSNGPMLTGSLKYERERYDLQAKINSQPSPSGDGFMLYRHQLDLVYRYRLTESSRLDLGLIGGRSESVDNRINNDRDYARGRVRLDYRFSEHWYVAGTYVYSWQDHNRAAGDADSNAINLSLIFQPGQLAWSR